MRYAVALAFVALAAAPGGTTPSGLRGTVTRSPTRPVCVVEEPCSAPAANITLQFLRPSHRAVTTRTDAGGHYRVALAAGVWTVGTAPRTRIGAGISPRTVRVYAGKVTRVDFDIDTGIR